MLHKEEENMAIDIVTIKNACQDIQNIADSSSEGYNKVISLINQAKEAGKADTIKLDGATMATPYDELIDLVNQVKNLTIESANITYESAKDIYTWQKTKEEEEERNSN